jgi:hypothetical protein
MENELNSRYTWDELLAHQEALRKLKAMMNVLSDDVNEFMEMAIVPNQIIPFSATRAYVRAVFALVEGLSFAFRQLAASLPKTDHCLSHGELAVLNDESYGLKDNGKVFTTTRFLKVHSGTRFTFDICKRVYGIQSDIDYGGKGWDSFMKAIKIRDRLMHPKSIESLDVSEDEIGIVSDGLEWFIGAVQITMDGMHAHLTKKAPLSEGS